MVAAENLPDSLPPGGARAVARCLALGRAPFSDMEGGLFRAYLTPAYRAARAQVAQWMDEAGMAWRIDAAGNLLGRHEGAAPGAPALIIASHLDSVRDGGVYDGPLGIMLGIEVVAALAGRRLPFAIEVYAFGDEEGSRFPAAMLTSRAVAGTLDPALLEVADGDGIALSEEIDTAVYLAARRPPGEVLAYLEAHIEQGPALEAEGLAVGTVTGIAAQLRLWASVSGMAGHAGTCAMPLRRDALAGAAEMVLAIERIAAQDASDLVATVGRIEAAPGAPNVIAGQVGFSIDIRSGEGARRDRAAAAIRADIAAIAQRRGLSLAVEPVHDLPASPCDPALMALMDAAMAEAGHRAFRLVSGAGHDAMVMAAIAPTAMLFIRCRGG
ncbi:MAG TPA: allantoate amidohydrolase, partial [Novosphingobium sp.]|nr:allantoate amidohydrolase [Novosphingobium sp.]